MGILFHRRAERSNCVPDQTATNGDQTSVAPDDPRQQFSDLKNQRTDVGSASSSLPGRSDIPPPAPAVDDPANKKVDNTTSTDRPRIGGSVSTIPPRESERQRTNQPSDLPTVRDLYGYSGNDQTRPQFRPSHLPPLTLTELPVSPPLDIPLLRMPSPIDGVVTRPNLQPLEGRSPGLLGRDVPPHPMPGPVVRDVPPSPTPGPLIREVPPSPTPGPLIREVPPRSVQGPVVRDIPEVTAPPNSNLQPPPRDLYQYNSGDRLVPSPPKELYQYNSGDRLVPPPPVPAPLNRDVPLSPTPGPIDKVTVPPSPEPLEHDPHDHPGPGSRRRHTLREQLNIPERPNPYRDQRQRPNDSRSDDSHPNETPPRPSPEPVERPVPPPVDKTRPIDRQRQSGDGKVTNISAAEFKELMKNSDRPFIVDVYRDGCPACTQLEPIMKGIAAQYSGTASVYKMHYNELAKDPELARQLRVHALPTTFVCDQGQIGRPDVGLRDRNNYTSKLDQLIIRHQQNDGSDGTSPPAPIPNRDRVQSGENDAESQNGGRQNHLSERLERIREKLSHLTHLTQREKEQAFQPSSDEQTTLELINQERRKYDLPPVIQDPRLQIIASRHTDYQTTHGMTHSERGNPGWQTVGQRMKQVGLEGWRENAATGNLSPQVMVQMWMRSPRHKEAILASEGNIAAVSMRNGKATFNIAADPELLQQRS
jgi:uncharacterized protein YkwD/thiol-disulfide isomerase/thioredoxin